MAKFQNPAQLSGSQQNGHSISNPWPFKDFDELQKRGREESEKVGGNPSILNAFLGAFYDQDSESANMRNEVMELTEENELNAQRLNAYESYIHDIREVISDRETEKEKLALEKENEIRELNVEIKRIKGGDYTLLGTDADPSNRLAYTIGSIIIVFLTGYLLLFYTSVIYNAFILEPISKNSQPTILNNDFTASMTITNLRSLPLVFEKFGAIGVLFLITGASMFIALGFLLHWFSKKGRMIWLWILYTFTFLLDVFLAYEIVYKIYMAKISMGNMGNEIIPWSFKICLSNMEFYIIIFAGFGIYVIWGILLNYLLQEHFKILPSKVGIKNRKAKIERLRADIKEIQARFDLKIKELRREVLDIKQREIGKLQNEINGNNTRIKALKERLQRHLQQHALNSQVLKSKITPFFSGWCQHIKMKNIHDEDKAKEEMHDCQVVLDKFYQTILI